MQTFDSPGLQISVTQDPPGTAIVTVVGELDVFGVTSLTQALAAVEADDEVEIVTLDLRALEFMDVAGLRALWSFQRRCRGAGRPLRVIQPRGRAKRLLELVGEAPTGDPRRPPNEPWRTPDA